MPSRPVAELMSRAVVTVAPEETLRGAINRMRHRQIRHLPVVDGGRLVGILTEGDVKRATPSLFSGIEAEEYYAVLDATAVAQVMTREPATIAPDSTVKSAVKTLVELKVGALPVVQDGILVGIITEIDLLRAFDELLEE